jgi:transcriptional regulator with XRE-family HTH domain
METIRLGARLRAARKAAGFKTSKSFLKKSKIPASTYSQHESGARIPDDDTLKFYSKLFTVNFDWLKNGKGLPYTQIAPKNNTLEEELLNLEEFKSNTAINHAVFTTILRETISNHASSIPTKIIKKIADDTLKLYAGTMLLDTSNKNHAKKLKSIINEYKNKSRQ